MGDLGFVGGQNLSRLLASEVHSFVLVPGQNWVALDPLHWNLAASADKGFA